MHAEFFDHDAIIVDLALAVRWDVVKEQTTVRIQAAARGHAARLRAKALAAAARTEAAIQTEAAAWVVDLKFRVVWEHPALTWDLALLWEEPWVCARRRLFYVTRHIDFGDVRGEVFLSQEEAFAKFDEYNGGSEATAVWDAQLTELKYYGGRETRPEEMKEWIDLRFLNPI